MSKITYNYESYLELLDLVNKLVNEYESIKYDIDDIDNAKHITNAGQIHNKLIELLSNYERSNNNE